MNREKLIKITLPIFLSIITLTLAFIFTSCSDQSPETIKPFATTTAPPSSTEPPATKSAPGNGPLPTAKQTAAVDSAEEAAEIAGFKVIEPSFIPEGYEGGKFTIINLGAGLPEEMKPKFNSIQVQRAYHHQIEPDTMILLIQTVHKFSVGGSEPVEICGHPAERSFTKADPQRVPYDSLTFGWEIGGNYFSLTGWLNETLDEATLIQMACSISID